MIRSLIILLALVGLDFGARAEAPRKPNILVILADDLGYADVGFHGCKDIPTPHLDALAKGGVRCTNGYVTGVYCSPTRAALLTGRYQQRFGHEFNPGGQQNPDFGLPLTETTMADRLRAAGYVTGLVGKWHLGNQPKFRPPQRGFHEYFGFLGGAHSYQPGTPGLFRGNERVEEKEYLTDALGREALAFIDRHKAKPFFLYLAFNAVHTPMHAAEERFKRFAAIENQQRRTYAAMLSAMDDAVGKVLEKLRSEKLEENSLIFFFSDNGGPVMQGTSVNGSNNAPLRGSKRTTLEGGIRVPFVVSWKGRLPAGKVYEHPVIQLDVLPTALTAAGVELKPDWKLDGVDLLPFLAGKSNGKPHETLYWRMGNQMALRHGDWKLVKHDGAPHQLYHLVEDIGESKDLAKEQSAKAQELLKVWREWDAQLAKPLWGG